MEETTTDADLQETQALDAQPVEQPAEAVQTADSEPQQQEEVETEEAADEPDSQEADNSGDDEDLSDYLSKKGIDVSTPEGQAALAKSYREAERALSRKAQEASALKKSIGEQPAGTEDERVRKLELAMQVNDWKETKGLTRQQDEAMGQYLASNPQKNLALQYGILTLDDVYAMSGANSVNTPDPAQLKKQGSQEALQQLANKQRATAPKGNASNNTVPQGLNKSNVEDWYNSLGTEGRQDPANRAKLDSILAS